MKNRIPLGPDYHAEPGETKGHQHDVYTTKSELFGYKRIHVGTLMKSAVEDLARLTATDAKALRSAVAALIRKNVRLEWHGHDHADINHRSTEAAAEEIVALLSAPSLSAGGKD